MVTGQKESPDSMAVEIGAEGIEALPRRVERYGSAKQKALDVAHFMRAEGGELEKVGNRVEGCGEYLLFRHYFTVDKVRLHAASFCMKHLLCPLCAIRRGAKGLKAYLDRWEVIRAEKPVLKPFLVTLTVKDGPDLAERFRHLFDSQHELWKRKHRKRGSCLDGVEGAVWSYEVKRGSGSGLWHPHLHMIALAEVQPDQDELRREWHQITGDSFMCDVRPIEQEDPAEGFLEVFKYAVKFSDQEPADTVHAFQVLKGRRLIGSAGAFWGVKVPEELTDEPLEGLPFVELFYRYIHGAGYHLSKRKDDGAPKVATPRPKATARAQKPDMTPRKMAEKQRTEGRGDGITLTGDELAAWMRDNPGADLQTFWRKAPEWRADLAQWHREARKLNE